MIKRSEGHLLACDLHLPRPMASSSDTGVTDVALLQLILQKDQAALAALYDRHATLMYTLVLRILKDTQESQDVLQEVFMSVWTRAHTYKSALGSPTAWLVRVARNRAIDRWRAAGRRRPPTGSPDPSGTTTAGHADPFSPAYAPHAPGRSPEAAASDAQVARSVGSALTCLPVEQRELIELAYFEGYTQAELAARFGLPLGTVKTRLRTGLLKLQQIFAGQTLQARRRIEGK